MSRPPNSRPLHGRSPSVEGEPFRRASTHSIGVSYAYGAPASPRASAGSPPNRARSALSASGSTRNGGAEGAGGGGGEETIQEEEGDVAAEGETGRAAEPASVRYGRIAQRKKDTGKSYIPITGSSVNIANAFKAATSGAGGVKTGGRREDFPPLDGTAGAGGGDEEQDEEEDDDIVCAGHSTAKEAKEPSAAPNPAKKRKKHGPRDPTFRHRAGETSSSEESGYDQAEGKQTKRTKVADEGDDLADDPTSANKPRRRSHKPSDPSYNPRRDPAFHDGQTSTSESDGGDSKTSRRRRSKGKGRASVGASSAASQAIPRGIRDGEIWYGKKRKGRKGSRKSTTNGDGEEEHDGEEGEVEKDDEEDMGGMDGEDFDNADDSRSHSGSQDPDVTPPAHSFYLRPKSPPSTGPDASVSASPEQRQQQPNPSPRGKGWTFAGSPFHFRSRSVSVQPGPASADPAFGAFDRSLNNGDEDGSGSLSVSMEDSVLRGSSYDFSEEEAIVRILEEKSAAAAMAGQENSRLDHPSPLLPNPVPSPSSSSQSLPQIRQTREETRRKEQPRQTSAAPSLQRQAVLAATPNLRHLHQQQQQQSPAAPSPAGSIGATPVPYTGAYPQTPAPGGSNGGGGAGSGSPVSAIRRRNGKSVPAPSMLGAGTKLAPPPDEDDEEAERSFRASRAGGFGEKAGMVMKPLVDAWRRAYQKTQNPLLDWVKIWKAVFVVLLTLFVLLAYLTPSASNAPVPSTSEPSSHSSIFDYIPFLRSSPPSPSYVPPSVPADSLQGLIARLTHLESAVGRVSSSSDSERKERSKDRQALDSLSTQLDVLDKSLTAEQQRAKSALEHAEKATAKSAAEVGKAVENVKGDLEALISRLKTLSKEREGDASELKKLQGSVDGVGKDLVALNAQVDKVTKDLEAATKHDRLLEIAVEAIGKKLPGKMAARVDESGRLEIDPAFWRVLKDAFADKKTTETKLVALQSPPATKGGLFGSGSSLKEVVKAPTPSPPSWSEFLSANEDALKAWVAADLSTRAGGGTGTDAFISKQQFLDLLKREIKTLKRDFENKANESFEAMGQELLGKVAKQDELRRKDAAAAAAAAASSQQKHSSSSPSKGSSIIRTADGDNVTAIISSLVDSALVRYSKDVLARPDYALYTSGGRVIRSLTSPTYEPHPISGARSALAWITGTTAPRGRPPVTALHPFSSPGSCWPFAGSYGQLGIQLSRRVVPTDVTIEHISTDVALDGDVSSAPRDFEVWGVVEGAEDARRLAQYRQEQLETKRAAREAGEESVEDDAGEQPASLPPSANHLLLAVGSYDPSAPSPLQTFPVTAAARQLGIPVNVVVVKVLSNHGEAAYTCLYRVRVSGTTVAQVAAAAAEV